jgi:uncharacterized membrane protein
MILLIIIAGLLIRLVSLNQSLWLDEGISIIFARSLSYKDLIVNFAFGDVHPPLYYVLLKSWILAFGSAEVSARMPSVLLGVGVIYITYKIGQKLYDSRTGLVASILIATGPLHIYYSQEARMYMLASFFASLSVYFFVSILKKDKLIYWAGFIFATTLMLYSEYLPYLLIPTYILYLFHFRKRISSSTLKSFIPTFLLIFLFISPWLFIIPRQLSGGLNVAAISPVWARVVGGSSLKDLALILVKFTIGKISSSNHLIYAALFLPVGFYFTLLMLVSILRISLHRYFLWFYLLVPIFLAFLLSHFMPIFSYHRLIFVLPAFYILLASGITNLNWAKATRVFLTIALIINVISTIIYLTNPKFHREDWKSAASYVKENASPKTIVLFESPNTIAPFDYYNKDTIKAGGVLDSFDPKKEIVMEKTRAYTQGKNKVFLFQYLSQITDSQGLAFQSLVDLGFQNAKTKDINGVGFIYEFTR